MGNQWFICDEPENKWMLLQIKPYLWNFNFVAPNQIFIYLLPQIYFYRQFCFVLGLYIHKEAVSDIHIFIILIIPQILLNSLRNFSCFQTHVYILNWTNLVTFSYCVNKIQSFYLNFKQFSNAIVKCCVN